MKQILILMMAAVVLVGCGKKDEWPEFKTCERCKETDIKYWADVCKHCGKDPDEANGVEKRAELKQIWLEEKRAENETADSGDINESSKGNHIPQAQPFFLLLEAVKNEDEHKLKTVHSEPIKKGLGKKGWANVMKQYQDAFKEQFGEYKLKEFTFEYEGSEMKGRVAIARNGNALGKLHVIYENGVWKMNER